MSNLFAWASIGENGRTVGGRPGDQTGREVKVGPYYYFGQDQVLRFRSVLNGRRAAKYAKSLAKNRAIGYNQNSRSMLFDMAEDCGWSMSKLKKRLKTQKVNCDCSSFASTVINLALGKRAVGCCTTATIVSNAMPTGYFKLMHVGDASKKWHKGDMPLKAGKHIIINV